MPTEEKEPPLTPQRRGGLAAAGAGAVLLLWALLNRHGSKSPVAPAHPVPSQTVPAEPAPPATSPGEGTGGDSGTAGEGSTAGGTPLVPEGAQPPGVAGPQVTDTVTGPAGRPRIVRRPGCTDEQVAAAERYSQFEGYEYLADRCDLIARWNREGGDIVERLAEWGFPSPGADCPREIEFRYGATRWNWDVLTVRVGGERADVRVPLRGPDAPVTVTLKCTAQVVDPLEPLAVELGVTSATQDVGGHPVRVTAYTVDQPEVKIVKLPPMRRGRITG
jgi:hypothetical protein